MDKKTLTIIIAGIMLLFLLDLSDGYQKSRIPSERISNYNNQINSLKTEAILLDDTFSKVKDDLKKSYLEPLSTKRGWGTTVEQVGAVIASDMQLITRARENLDSSKRELEPQISATVRQVKNSIFDAQNQMNNLAVDVNRFIGMHGNPQKAINEATAAYRFINELDTGLTFAKISRAQLDWPAKRDDLDSRKRDILSLKSSSKDKMALLIDLKDNLKDNNAEWVQVAVASVSLIADRQVMADSITNLEKLIGQLYYSRDKILEDMENSRGRFLHKYKTIKIDSNNRQTITSELVEVTQNVYNKHKNNLGMTLDTKPKGVYEFETQHTPAPPGYNYVGNSRYGRWERDGSGRSFWAFYGQYMFMRSLFWGSYYSPVYYNNYSVYQNYRRSGRTFYGSRKEFGSRGSFTKSRYSKSKYMKSGGYAGSKFSSNKARRTASASRGFSRSRSGGFSMGK